MLNEYVAKEKHNQKFGNLSKAEQKAIQEDAAERYLAYIMLKQSSKHHEKLCTDLQNNFMMGDTVTQRHGR